MNSYRLDPENDDQFLEGKEVIGNFVLPVRELESVREGTRLVVQLSNGKKYLGEVTRLIHARNGSHVNGTLHLRRVSKL